MGPDSLFPLNVWPARLLSVQFSLLVSGHVIENQNHFYKRLKTWYGTLLALHQILAGQYYTKDYMLGTTTKLFTLFQVLGLRLYLKEILLHCNRDYHQKAQKKETRM